MKIELLRIVYFFQKQSVADIVETVELDSIEMSNSMQKMLNIVVQCWSYEITCILS